MRLALALALALVAAVGGCSCSGQIHASAIATTARSIRERHDRYVRADASLTPLEVEIDLRDTALLADVIDAAIAAGGSATTSADTTRGQ